MTTIQNIPSIGSPTDDPALSLPGRLYIPDPILFPGNRPSIVGTRAGGFTQYDLRPIDTPFRDLAGSGYRCLAFNVRVMNGGLPGQTTDGKFRQQVDDFKIGVRYMRALAGGTGMVGSLGGSGSAHHGLWAALEGIAGDDLVDFCIALSPPTDFSDRDHNNQHFITETAAYARLDPSDLVGLRAVSPIALIHNSLPPIWHANGVNEAMPYGQLTLFRDAMITADIPNYTAVTNEGDLGRAHAFAMWGERNGVAGVNEAVKAWLAAVVAAWEGGGEAPPDDIGLLQYNYELYRKPDAATPYELVTSGHIPANATSFEITGLPDSSNNLFAIQATNKYGPGLWNYKVFEADRARVGGTTINKKVPTGIIAYIPTSLGLVPNMEDLTFWGNRDIIGARLQTNWAAIEPTEGTFNTDTIDQFLALCEQNKKRAGLGVSAGVDGFPFWLAAKGMQTFTWTGTTDEFPIPWDPIFQGEFISLIIQLGVKYDSNGALSYLTTGGLSSENKTSESLLKSVSITQEQLDDIQASAEEAGYSSLLAAWLQAPFAILPQYPAGFPKTPTVVDLQYFLPYGVDAFLLSLSNLVTIAKKSLNKQMMGFMHEELTVDTNGTSPLDISVFSLASAGLKVKGSGWTPTELGAILDAGLALNPRFIEISLEDVEEVANATVIRNAAATIRDNQRR